MPFGPLDHHPLAAQRSYTVSEAGRVDAVSRINDMAHRIRGLGWHLQLFLAPRLLAGIVGKTCASRFPPVLGRRIRRDYIAAGKAA